VYVLVLAVQSSHLGAFTAALAVGLVIAVAGHIVKSRTLIVTGILVIGLVSAYFSFVLQPAGR
jgi:dolichyl-phosphate-mannose--protein O-mannosyl transferase